MSGHIDIAQHGRLAIQQFTVGAVPGDAGGPSVRGRPGNAGQTHREIDIQGINEVDDGGDETLPLHIWFWSGQQPKESTGIIVEFIEGNLGKFDGSKVIDHESHAGAPGTIVENLIGINRCQESGFARHESGGG